MGASFDASARTTAVVEAYGARLAVSAPDAELLQRIVSSLPRGWNICSDDIPGDKIAWRFAVMRDETGYRIQDGDGQERHCDDPELAVWMLRTQMRRYVGHHAPDLTFVHAGVVAHQGKAILLPGHSFAGKSTLVHALVDAGADFYSDEYAMLDREGLVAQYREPLVIRGPNGREEVDVGPTATQPRVPVGLVALAVYKPGADWKPRRLTAGEGVVRTMEHCVPARDRPAETLETLGLALASAEILQGERGDADETAKVLLDAVSALHG